MEPLCIENLNTNIHLNPRTWLKKTAVFRFGNTAVVSNSNVFGTHAIASAENVRIAPSLRSQKGAIWTKSPTNFDWWEVDMVFRITGRGRIGADGLAFWYTQNKGSYEGDVFGSSDKWVGLGIFFDSFDNDNKHNNPYIYAMVNDGTKQFDHQNDGLTQSAAGCLRDFRNKPFPTRARIEYYQNTLTLLFHNGMTSNDQDYEMCLRVDNIVLPKNGYFGISAATGGLADDHDVLHFLTNSLWPVDQAPVQSASEEQQRLAQEYQEYQNKLEQQKQDYRKEHPEHQGKQPEELEDWFESDSQRELRQIFQGQSQIYDVLRELNRKLDEMVGRQERTLSLISMQQQAAAVGGQAQQAGGQPSQAIPTGYIDTIRRDEVTTLFNNQNQLANLIKDVKQLIATVSSQADKIIINQSKQPTAQIQPMGYDMQSLVAEMRDGLNHVKQNVAQFAAQRPGGTCPSCVSVTTLLIIAVIQLAIYLGYSIYRDNKDSHYKKFY
ncbi:protein ERGIC-53 isoform X2 [Agrilus planipennis]|uniref:Protein ERGIC-53 isoform X2 n=1 Tax=Agrilus planipennis TaxID=224129 RepID=A0A1W4XH52_AGRPL|nr:protein ERGIC-53 isoform X2 [Agrilus planipennis]